jgi:predicted transcriptional regulator YdeE
MRRKPLLIVIVLVVLVAILYIPLDKKDVIKINASYFNCYQQLASPQNWEKWQSDINGVYQTDSSLCKLTTVTNGFKIMTPDENFIVQKQSSTSFAVKRNKHNNEIRYNCAILPDTSGLITSMVINYSTSVMKYIFSRLSGTNLYQADIYDFKKYMEDTNAYYGYYIKTDFLTEKKIIVNRKTVLTKDVLVEAATMRNQLYHYIKQKDLKQTAPLMLQYTARSQDSVQVMLGIPVHKAIRPGQGFLYMEIPAGNVLVADFSGRYNDKHKVYAAMEKYVQDRRIHKKIAPLEVFDGALPGNADDVAIFRIVYPVF